MVRYAYPALYAVFVWWFSTGLIIGLDNLPPRTFRWSMLGGSLVLVAALFRLVATAGDTNIAGAYAAFTCGVLIWGWQEMSFFMGFITGPRQTACAHGCSGWRHFLHGVEACLYHELTIIAFALAMLVGTWGAPNQIGLWTFLAIWVMRQSAKLNFFLGVRNLSEEFVPRRLAYLTCFMRRRNMNPLFPASVLFGGFAAFLLLRAAVAPGIAPVRAVGLTFLGTILTLAVIEHVLLVLPLPFARLWHWALEDGALDERKRGAGEGARGLHDCDDEASEAAPSAADARKPAFRRPAAA